MHIWVHYGGAVPPFLAAHVIHISPTFAHYYYPFEYKSLTNVMPANFVLIDPLYSIQTTDSCLHQMIPLALGFPVPAL